jgi:hypothetical protein
MIRRRVAAGQKGPATFLPREATSVSILKAWGRENRDASSTRRSRTAFKRKHHGHTHKEVRQEPQIGGVGLPEIPGRRKENTR